MISYPKLNEKSLISKSKRGDTKAFEEIIYRNSRYILSWIIQKTTDQQLIDDVHQMTMIKCWRNLKRFKGDSAFKTWACTIARNLIIDNYRKRQRRKECYIEDGIDKINYLNNFTEEFEPVKGANGENLRLLFAKIIPKLSLVHRNTLYYYAIKELSYKEISKLEKCSVGTVMSRIFYARKRAQELIKINKGYQNL